MGPEIDGEQSCGSPAEAESTDPQLGRALDDPAHRFDQRDSAGLGRTGCHSVLSMAVLVAAWSAHQASLWGGVQFANASEHIAQLTLCGEVTTRVVGKMETDSQMMAAWLMLAAEDNERGMQVFEERFNYTLRPAFDTWMAGSTDGDLPPGIPLDPPEYVEALGDGFELWDLHPADATAAAEAASEANRTVGSFVVITVIMASVMFLAAASLLGAGAITAVPSLPQQPVGPYPTRAQRQSEGQHRVSDRQPLPAPVRGVAARCIFTS